MNTPVYKPIYISPYIYMYVASVTNYCMNTPVCKPVSHVPPPLPRHASLPQPIAPHPRLRKGCALGQLIPFVRAALARGQVCRLVVRYLQDRGPHQHLREAPKRVKLETNDRNRHLRASARWAGRTSWMVRRRRRGERWRRGLERGRPCQTRYRPRPT